MEKTYCGYRMKVTGRHNGAFETLGFQAKKIYIIYVYTLKYVNLNVLSFQQARQPDDGYTCTVSCESSALLVAVD